MTKAAASSQQLLPKSNQSSTFPRAKQLRIRTMELQAFAKCQRPIARGRFHRVHVFSDPLLITRTCLDTKCNRILVHRPALEFLENWRYHCAMHDLPSRVFLSHSSKYKEFVRELYRRQLPRCSSRRSPTETPYLTIWCHAPLTPLKNKKTSRYRCTQCARWKIPQL